MSNFIASKSVITVNGIELTGYKTQPGQWVMSITQVATLLNVTKRKVSEMVRSKWLQLAMGNTPKVFDVLASTEGGTQEIVAIDTKVFNQIVLHEYASGNSVALTLVPVLMTQALDIRFEGTLTPHLSYAVVESTALDVKKARVEARNFHQGFRNWCVAGKYHGRWAHDYLTKRLAGMTAPEARLQPLYAGSDASIGLDHYQAVQGNLMANIALVKDTLACQSIRRNESYQDAIDRAIQGTALV